MRRITDVRCPPLGARSDQRHWLRPGFNRAIVECVSPWLLLMMRRSRALNRGRGDWISPRGIDLQINGGLGLAFPELTPADLPRLRRLQERLWQDGVEAIAPTLVTCGVPPLRRALAVLREARAQHRSAAAGCWEPIWKDRFWRRPAAVPIPVNTWPTPAWKPWTNASVGSNRRSP